MRFPSVMLTVCLLFGHRAQAQESVLSELREAAKNSPSDVGAQVALGRALIKAGRLPEAETQMRLAVRLSKGLPEILYEAMRVRFASDNYQKARAGCQELVRKDKDHVLTHVCMARAFLVWRRSSRALEFIDKAQAQDPSNYEVQLVLGDDKRMQGEFDAAEAAYSRAIALRPASAEAGLGLGLTYALENKLDAAIAALRKASALEPRDPDIAYELGKRLQGAEAVALLQTAVTGRPNWLAAQLELAIAQLKAGDAKNADTSLLALLKRNPNHPVATAQHGVALAALGRYADAEPVLLKALKLAPNDYDTSFALARLYEQTTRYDEALAQYRSTADLKRENPAPLIAAAKLGLVLKRPLLSGALLDKALERAPRSAEALALYGDVLLARGELPAAREHYTRALQAEGPLDRVAVQKRLTTLK